MSYCTSLKTSQVINVLNDELIIEDDEEEEF